MMFCSKQRARAPEDKEQRRADLLAAARKLFGKGGGALPSVAEIAEAAGVSKGTLYLYFKTKEEAYLALHAESVRDWLARIIEEGDRNDPAPVFDRVLGALTGHLADNPDLQRLSILAASVLEQNVSEEAALGYKREMAAALASVVGALQRAFPALTPRAGVDLIVRTYALVIGLWQMAEPSPVIRKVIAEHAELSFFRIDFQRELQSALRLVWRDAVGGAARAGV